MPKKIRSFCRTRTSSSFPALNASMAKSHVMSTPIPLMNTLFVGCAPRLPGSLNVMKGTNQLSLPASSPFSVALFLYLRLLNLSRLDTAMTTRLSNSCVPSFATTRWSCAFLGSRTPSMLCRLNRHWPVGLSPLQLRLLHISPPCPMVSNLTLPLLRNSINLPRQEGRLRRDQLQRLRPPQRQKAPLLALFLLHTLANPHPALTAYSGPSRTPVGAHPAHPYQRAPSPAGKGKGPDTRKGKDSGPSYAEIAGKGKKGQKSQKGQKGPKGKNPKGNKGQKGQQGEYAGPILEGGKGPAKGDSK